MYISKGQHYTYGVKSWNDIFSISNPEDWSTVFCTDNYRVWWYHSDKVWMTNDCVLMNVDAGNGSLSTGNVVDLETSSNNACQIVSLSSSSAKPIGVVLDVNPTQTKASIAVSGKYKGIAGSSIVIANGLRADTTNGRMNDDATSDGSPNIGAFANALESGSDGDLLWVNVFVKREFY